MLQRVTKKHKGNGCRNICQTVERRKSVLIVCKRVWFGLLYGWCRELQDVWHINILAVVTLLLNFLGKRTPRNSTLLCQKKKIAHRNWARLWTNFFHFTAPQPIFLKPLSMLCFYVLEHPHINCTKQHMQLNRNTSTGTLVRLRARSLGVRNPVGVNSSFLCSPKRADRLRGPASLLRNGYWELKIIIHSSVNVWN